jgi:hypothetical protein
MPLIKKIIEGPIGHGGAIGKFVVMVDSRTGEPDDDHDHPLTPEGRVAWEYHKAQQEKDDAEG